MFLTFFGFNKQKPGSTFNFNLAK